jgi:hypothetical protein
VGNYNPHAPYILGQEWVPIRDEDLVYSPLVSTVERGTAFTLATAQRPRDARFYVNQMPADLAAFHVGQVNIYPYGQEDQTGPVREVIVPVSAVNVTGTGISFLTGSYLEAITYPGDNNYIYMSYNLGSPQRFGFFFDALSSYPELANKRILNVSLLYSAAAQDSSGGVNVDYVQPAGTSLTVLSQTDDAGNQQQFLGKSFGNGVGSLSDMNTKVVNSTALNGTTVETVNLGDINNAWNTADIGGTEKLPWRYVDMLRMTSTYGTGRQYIKLNVNLQSSTPNAIFYLQYIALRVIYCEEKRVAYGGQQFGYVQGMNKVTLRDLNQAADPVLAAGQYLSTLTFVNPGQVGFGTGLTADFPQLNAVEELYQIPSHPAVELDIPFPLEDQLGETFTAKATHILPQLSLHASGSTLTDPHVYGRQAWARVYGSNTATQEIYDDISGVNAAYPQVRFYARRFGDTTIPLTITGTGIFTASTASITVADFDDLPEIFDGAKEVTLRFSTVPSMGAATGTPGWTWSAVGETAGNHWEVLAASAPALSGVPGSYLTQVPTAQRLGTATYQPPSGDTVELTWMPQGVASAWVTGASSDAATDAVLIFSQDPPTVTGVALTAQTQTLTGIGLDCGSLPCCVPSGIGYQRITWSATTLPVSGFGGYELQRFDYLDPTGDFQTIMLATDPTLVTFNDYEARTGITSVYRIRAINALNFNGLWSTYVSGTPSAAGVTGACADSTGALIFTSNADQSGLSNAAYVMQWDGTPVEDFDLPEADMVQFQPMFGRDGSIAFHGTERGLERFNRWVLLQAAAIDPIRLADAKTIRDLAWADLPYVCVRDGRGDRWFSNVRIPTVNARLDATRYMASIEITETTRTPYPVDP